MSAAPEALGRLIPLLECPHCGRGVEAVDTGVVCSGGHSFDRARQGYLTLFGPRGRRFPGDTAAQVAARDRVLGSGLFDGVAEALTEAALTDAALGNSALGNSAPGNSAPGDAALHGVDGRAPEGLPSPVLLEAGAGTGFYLDHVVEAVRAAHDTPDRVRGVGTEISVPAARRLAKVNPLVAAVVADTWDRLPVVAGSVDLLQVVFAPRNTGEFARVLRPGGTLVIAVPGEGHLEPLRTRTGMLEPVADKGARLDADMAGAFEPVRVRHIDISATVPTSTAVDLALMGPSGVHLDRTELEGELGPGESPVRLHVEVRSYRALQQ